MIELLGKRVCDSFLKVTAWGAVNFKMDDLRQGTVNYLLLNITFPFFHF